jgi:saccharopine dehydrogenase-like NADP-dependent oxidoreductase
MTADSVTQTVLVLGGYGFFGHRICAALARNQALRVLIAGRDITRATTAAHSLGLPPEQAVCLNAQAPDLAGYLRRLQVDILIHTAGPFQGQDYTVARAAIEAGCHYIDLADGREFVAGITALDIAAKERGLTITSGASSVPALSSALPSRLCERCWAPGCLDSRWVGEGAATSKHDAFCVASKSPQPLDRAACER